MDTQDDIRRERRTWSGVVACLLLFVAACTSSDEPEAVDDTDTSEPTTDIVAESPRPASRTSGSMALS